MDLKQYRATLEAMLFAVAEPVSEEKLAEILEITIEDVNMLLTELRDDYSTSDKGFVLLQYEDRWQFATNPAYEKHVRAVLDTRRNTPLSPSALEVLAIVAYNQPVSRMFVEEVRGVDSTSGINTLVNRGLLEERGRLDLPGRPIAYGTTDVFLRTFGLTSLADLPSLQDDTERLVAGYMEEDD